MTLDDRLITWFKVDRAQQLEKIELIAALNKRAQLGKISVIAKVKPEQQRLNINIAVALADKYQIDIPLKQDSVLINVNELERRLKKAPLTDDEIQKLWKRYPADLKRRIKGLRKK